jgi:tetratricopeptide (TPR) repeat protein
VTVVIGYDDEAGTIELQDPMTHHVISIPVPELDRLRHTLYNSALVAFPPSDENQETLARLGIFKDEVLTLIDQASLASEMGNLSKVTELMDLATRIRPEHGLAWEFLLQALLHQWWSVSENSRSATVAGTQGEGPSASLVQGFRSAFYSALGRARQAHPTAEFCFIFEGRAAVVDRNLPQALEAFQKALEIQPANPETLADIAECQFELDHVEQALESAQKAVKLVPSSVTANVWLGRCLADLTKPHAEYYARVGLDLAPTWWLSHLVMADVLMNASQDRELPENAFPASLLPEQEAWKEINYVLAADPHQLYALLLRAIIMMRHSDFTSARSVLQKALESAQAYPADPIIIHRLNLWLCLSYYNQGLFDEARKQVLEMLEKEPRDPWALQHLAAVEFNQLKRLRQEAITKGEPEPDIQPAIDRYLSAIQANRGDPDVVATFVSFLMQLGKDDEAIKILKSLCEQYPSQPNLLFHYGMVLSRAEKKEPVASVLLDALSKENGIYNTDELSDAYNAIILELGPQKGEEAILKISLPPGQTTLQRDRSLGLILASYPKEKGDRARQLLEKVLADDPQDAEVIFWMGLNLALTEEEHEQLLRQALTIAPHWGYARWSLIRYLLQKSRIEDALELSRGYEGESLSLLRQHIYCLNALGFFEEALPAADHLIGDVALYGERTSNDYAMKVDVYSYNGEHQKALETVQQARKLFPDDLAWHMSECIAYCNLEQADPARAAIDQGEARGLEMRLVNEGRYWIETFQGHWPGAMNIARQQEQVEWDTCEKDKDHPAGSLVLWSNRYLALLAHLSEPHEVENYLKVIYQDNRLWENIPIILGHVRCNQLALKYSEKILKEPTVWENARYYALLGRALASRNLDDPNAQAYFAEIQYMFPRATGAYETLACYAALDGNLDLAASLAEQAIANLRSSPSAWAVRGLVHFLSGWRKAALDTLNRGWSRFPWDRFTDFPLWWLYFSLQGNQLKAQQWKQKALDQAQSSFDRRLIEIIQSRLE